MRCRKNYRDLTVIERDRFVAGLHHLKSTGIIDQFANDHATFFGSAHGHSHFLPWHREFLRRFEDALRTSHPDISIPYWNSTVDTSVSDPLWDTSFLGQFDAAWSLGRNLGADTLPPEENVQTALDIDTYDNFRPYVEGNALHNPPHRWVGGVMGGASSPGDPVFYLHHCWIDLIWAQWQLLHGGPGSASNFISSGAGRGLTDPMAPWSTTPEDVLDHRDINLYHYPSALQQDLPQVSLDVPVINFIDVPEGETRLTAAIFSLNACRPVHFTVINGPIVTSGPASTLFETFVSPVTADPDIDAKARIWFSYQGTADGDVATGTVTIRCDETNEEFIINITANTISRPTAAFVMVLDQSNSMNFESGIGPGIEREDVLKFSAPTAVVVLDDNNAMAVCSFDHDAHPGLGITPAAGVGKLAINGAIASYSPNPNGWTSIGEGVDFAHSLLAPITEYDTKAMVVLTDGQENHGPHVRRYITDVADQISSLNGHIFAIGLGRAEVLNPTALQSLCSGNNGYMMMTGDLTPDASFRLAKYYQQIFASVTNDEIVLDPEGNIGLGQEHRIPFSLNETDISAKCILLTAAPYAIQFVLESPDGDIIDPSVAGALPVTSFELGSHVALYRIGLPLPIAKNAAHAGQWYARLKLNRHGYKKYLSSIENNPVLYRKVLAHGINYSFNVHAYSNLRMKAYLSQSSFEPGSDILIRCLLSEYGIPISARAICSVELLRPDNTNVNFYLQEIEPGIFEGDITAMIPGIYQFRIIAEGRTLRGRSFTREQTQTGAVWKGGDNNSPSGKDDPNRANDHLCHLLNCLLEKRSFRALLEKAGLSIGELKGCLKAYCVNKRPGESFQNSGLRLSDRLRSIINDEDILHGVLNEIKNQIELD